MLAIYESTRSGGGGGFCCGYHDDEGWYYKVAYDGITIKEGNEFQSSDYLQFGGGCQMPSKDKSASNDRRSLFIGASVDDTSAENRYVAVDEKSRRYFPRSPDISELGQSVQPLPDCTEHQGRTGCIVNPSSSRGAFFHLPSISYKQNSACNNDTCTIGIPMSKKHVDFAEQLLPNVQHIGFTEAKTKSLPNSSGRSYGIAAGDLNGDGLVDLVVATGSGTIKNQIYINSGNKAIPFKDVIDLPYSNDDSRVVKLSDIDNDSLLDILFISDQKAFVLFNNITEPLSFSRRVALDIGDFYADDLSVGDANNDGWLDIIVRTNSSGIIMFINMKNDTFDKIELPQLWGAANQVEFVDIDNDGRIDIISLSYLGSVRVFMNKHDNAGTFLEEAVILVPGEYTRFCVGDMDGDEFPDLILAKNSDGLGSVELLVNNGTGFHDSKTLIPPQAYLDITSIEAGDLNDDGSIDLVFGTIASLNFMILNKGGGGEFTEAIDLPGGLFNAGGIVIADVNNDSALDIVIANWYGGDEVLLNLLPIDFSSFGAALSLPGGTTDTWSMAFGDFNQDGFIDIVVGNDGQADQVILNKGDGSFLEEEVIDLPTNLTSSSTRAVAVGEIIGELPDIVVCGLIGCEILRNKGNLTFDLISLSSWYSEAIGIGDVNNDTFMDVIIGGYGSDGDTLFINNNGTFSADNSTKLPGFNETNGYTRSIAVADVNGDNW